MTMRTGSVFGSWTLLALAKPGRRARWICRCVCGTEREVMQQSLKSGRSASCGCLQRAALSLATKINKTTHGMTKTSTYRSWAHMRERCTNPNARQWKWYGALGVTVCERWASFENFLADMGVRPDGMTLDRIDSTRGYEPSNCRWADSRTQRINRRPQ